MPSVGKKESKILHAIARKRLKDLEKIETIQEFQQKKQAIEEIKPWPLAKYTTAEALETAITEYFEEVNANKEHPTVTGLALKLGIDRRTLLEYNHKDIFAPAINRAREMILNYTEQMLISKDKFTPWQIFYLKNNYKQDYQDKIEVENKHSGSISLVELSRLAKTLDESDIIEGELLEDNPQEG